MWSCHRLRGNFSGGSARHGLSPHIIEKGERGGLAVFDGDLDSTLGAVQEFGSAVALVANLLRDCLKFLLFIGGKHRDEYFGNITRAQMKLSRFYRNKAVDLILSSPGRSQGCSILPS